MTSQTCHESQPLDAVEVSVLDRHDARIREELLREVVDQLRVQQVMSSLSTDPMWMPGQATG